MSPNRDRRALDARGINSLRENMRSLIARITDTPTAINANTGEKLKME
jgi:hypothetical protein